MKKLLAFIVCIFVSIFTFASPTKATSCAITSESISPNSVALSAGSTGVTWTVSASCQSPYIHNTANGSGYLCNGGSCVVATATPVRNSYTYTFSFLLNQSSPAGVWTPRMTLSSSDGVTKFDIGSNSSVVIFAYVAPTTTTTVAPTTTPAPTPTPTTTIPMTTTTTTIPMTTTTTVYNPRITYCQAIIVGYVNSIPQWNYANWQQANELLSTYSSSALLYPNSYKYPVPAGGCSSLNTIQTTTTTSSPVVQQKVQVAPISSTNEIPPSLTYESLNPTTIRLYIQNSNSNLEHLICPEILNKQKLDGSWACDVIKLKPGQLTYDYKLSHGNTDNFNVGSYDLSVRKWSGWSVWHRFTNTYQPIAVLPLTTVPPTTVPAPYVAPVVPASWKYVQPWKYVWKEKTSTKQIKTGALCYSGKISTATSSGACSHNGGVKNWIYYSTKSTSKVKYKCWLNKNTNTYNKNCIAV